MIYGTSYNYNVVKNYLKLNNCVWTYALHKVSYDNDCNFLVKYINVRYEHAYVEKYPTFKQCFEDILFN